MIKEALFGGFFTFLPGARAFLNDIVYPERAVCGVCGRLSEGGVLCGECKARLISEGMIMAWDREELEPGLDAYVLRPHTGVARQLVLRLKHSAEKCMAEELADLLLPVPSHIFFSPETVVTWVPMPENRRRERCIDHGKILAEAVAVRLNLTCRPLLFRRNAGDKTQAGLSRQDREANLSGAFASSEKITFPVLLVDDVLTTGTTARRCAEALRKGGAAEVTFLAFTRAMGNVPSYP